MWETKAEIDSSTTGVGVLTAVWTDANGIFSFSERTILSDEGRQSFAQRAVAARDKWRQNFIDNQVVAASLADELVSIDGAV